MSGLKVSNTNLKLKVVRPNTILSDSDDCSLYSICEELAQKYQNLDTKWKILASAISLKHRYSKYDPPKKLSVKRTKGKEADRLDKAIERLKSCLFEMDWRLLENLSFTPCPIINDVASVVAPHIALLELLHAFDAPIKKLCAQTPTLSPRRKNDYVHILKSDLETLYRSITGKPFTRSSQVVNVAPNSRINVKKGQKEGGESLTFLQDAFDSLGLKPPTSYILRSAK